MLTMGIACNDGGVPATEATYSAKVSSFKVDPKMNYNQVLIKGLNLNDKEAAKVKNILASYRKNVQKTPDKEQKLKDNRKKKLSRILSEMQMAQRRFINSKYYNTKPKYPTHPINVQKKYGLSDAQVMKLIEIEYSFKADKNVRQKKERVTELMGAENTTSFLESKGIIIW